jgi:hypothetical protein
MDDELVLARASQCGERQEPGVVAEPARDLRLVHRLRLAAGEPRDHHHGSARPLGRAAEGKLQHPLEQPGLANGELGGVDADREPAGTGVEIVTGKRALAAGIELAVGVERERMRRNHHALAQRGEHLRVPILPAQRHAAASSNQVVTVTVW